ncbi:MAG TPA: bifunctional hydroxymethylpyrimidine kinase/phosphomethylpyrimidine kinase [Candidatus Binataceae bacterium]|nr:bifunctional hydroxymethylpyrimidine kinase/phosphomethylpyrimidine kinase [Candidatus Binataceae bacterium]
MSGSTIPLALTIAGSDPGGGAGIQSDIRTFAALGVYGYSVITSIIAQSSSRVTRVDAVKPAMIAAQIEVLLAESMPLAIKTGAMGSAGAVRETARAIVRFKMPRPVVDPVTIASSGARLIDKRGERMLRDELIPLARIVTPNVPEAEALAGIAIRDRDSIREGAAKILAMGAKAVVIKGGHFADRARSTDLYFDGRKFIELRAPRQKSGAHGTGCVFSAAIAAHLARGAKLEDAVSAAKEFVTLALANSFKLGRGRAVLDQFSAVAR